LHSVPRAFVLQSPKTQTPTALGITFLKDFQKEYTSSLNKDAIIAVAETPLGGLGCLVETELLIPEAARTLGKKRQRL
jgi:hypothetical protein